MKRILIFIIGVCLCTPVWGGVDLNGDADYLLASDVPLQSGDVSCYIWAKVDITGTATSTLMGSKSGAVNGWVFKAEQFNNSGFVGFTFRAIGDYTTSIAPPATWTPYIAVHDDSANTVDIYVGSSSEQLAVGEIAGPTANGLYIGAYNPSGITEYLTGGVAEAAFWDRVLTAQEISILLNSQVRRMPLQMSTNLLGYWALDDFPSATLTPVFTTNPAGTTPLNFIDKDEGTQWVSGALMVVGHYVKLDFGFPVEADEYRLYSAHVGDWPLKYKLQSSDDDSNWTDRVTVTASDGDDTDTFAAASARYWRIYVTENKAAWWGGYEFYLNNNGADIITRQFADLSGNDYSMAATDSDNDSTITTEEVLSYPPSVY